MTPGTSNGQLAMIREVIANELLALSAIAVMFLACVLA